MQYLESFENYQKHNEIFTGLGRLAGRAIGAATNFLGGKSQATNTSDNDLAREILAYVQNMPRNYNTTGQLNYRNVNKTGNTRYMFIGNPFDTLVIENDKKLSGKEKIEKKKDIWSYTSKTDNDWRIDILKHGDYKTTNDPEYAIYISKVNGGEVRPETPPVNRKYGPDEDEQKENKPENKEQKSLPPAKKQLLLGPGGDEDDKADVLRGMTDDQIEDLIKSNPGSAGIIKRLWAKLKGKNLKPSIKDSYSYQIDEQRANRNYGGLGSGLNLSGQRTRQNIDINPTFGKNQKLACTQGLSEEIWQLCYEINQATTRTNTGDARGGVASQQPFRPRY
jgi:ribosomal protein S13